MKDAPSIACSLSAGDLEQRLAQIRAIGEESLAGHETLAGRHLLRFRPGPATRKRLEEIVAAEALCCSFLELGLERRGGELLLSISAPAGGREVADVLAAAFADRQEGSTRQRPAREGDREADRAGAEQGRDDSQP